MSEKKLITTTELFFLMLAILIMIYAFMSKNDINITKKTETVEIVENPNSDDLRTAKKMEKVRKKRAAEKKKSDKEIEAMLDKLKNKIQEEEAPAKFAKESKASEDSGNLLSTLKASHKTYSKVKELFTPEGEEPTSTLEDVGALLKNETVRNTVFKRLEDAFEIPEAESEAFAKKGKKALSDWAKFVEENKEQ